MPEAPEPAIALPMIKAIDVGAAPQMSEPSSKSPKAIKVIHFTEKKVYSLPNERRNELEVRKYALPYHPTSCRALN